MNKKWTNTTIFEAIMSDARKQVKRGHPLDMSTYGVKWDRENDVLIPINPECGMCFAGATVVSRKAKFTYEMTRYEFSGVFDKSNEWGDGFQSGILWEAGDKPLTYYSSDEKSGYLMGKRCLLAARKEGLLHDEI